MILCSNFQSNEDDEEQDELQNYLNQIDGGVRQEVARNGREPSIDTLLLQFRKTTRVDLKKCSFMEYWESNKTTNPELYEVAMISNAVPMTQVSVERLFSSMKFIYSCLRSNLAPPLLEDILIVRSNGLFRRKKIKGKNRRRARNTKNNRNQRRVRNPQNN